MEEKNYRAIIEAILFTLGESVELGKIAETIELSKSETKKILEQMMNEWNESDRGVTIMELDGSYQMCTKSEMYEYLIKIAKQPKRRVLTDVLLETLSIIAYKQPVTKAEIEKIRGVSSEHAVSKLVEYNLVCELGRLDAPGRPLLFGTTEEFLRSFGVNSIDNLPVLSPVLPSISAYAPEYISKFCAANTFCEGNIPAKTIVINKIPHKCFLKKRVIIYLPPFMKNI